MIVLAVAWNFIATLLVFAAVIVGALLVGYKLLLRHLKKDVPTPVDYAKLETLDEIAHTGTVELAFNVPRIMTLRFELVNAQNEVVKIFTNQDHEPGRYTFSLDTTALADGIYKYRLTSDNRTVAKRLAIYNNPDNQ